MLNLKFHFVIAILLFLPLLAHQQNLDQVDVQVIVHEKTGNSIVPLANAKLNISEIGPIQTNEQGVLDFVFPLKGNGPSMINISMLSDKHKILKPLDSSVELDDTREKIVIDFLVVNMGDESPEFKNRIAELERSMSRLQAKNELTRQQLNAYKSKLVDTILYFEANRIALNNQIADLSAESENLRQENESLRLKLAALETEVSRLTDELQLALEERYLRQNAHFKVLSKSLLEFVQRAKDVRDELPFIKQYYNAPGGYEGYGEKLKNYERIFTEINTQQESYLEGIERYWDNKQLSRELGKVLQFLLEGVHLKQIRPTVNSINEELRKQKPNNAQKTANISFDMLDVNIKVLEKDVSRILQKVRKNL